MNRLRRVAFAMAAVICSALSQGQAPGVPAPGAQAPAPPASAQDVPTLSRPSPSTVPEPAPPQPPGPAASAALKIGTGIEEGLKALPSRQVVRSAARQAADGASKQSTEALRSLRGMNLGQPAKFMQGLDTLSDIEQVGNALVNEGGNAAAAEATDVVLNNAAGSWGAAGGAWVGGLTCGPVGIIVMTVFGAVCASATYQRYASPYVKSGVRALFENAPPRNAPQRETWKSLVIEGPGAMQPGTTAEFRAFAAVVVEYQVPQFGPGSEDAARWISRELAHLDVTQRASWSTSAGSLAGAGSVYADCNQEGSTLTLTASIGQREASRVIAVEPSTLAAIEVAAEPAQAYPGATVALSAVGSYGIPPCQRRQPLTQLTWQSSAGGSVSGSTLRIDPDKTSGSISISATGPGKVASNTAVVTVLKPELQRIEIQGPPSAKVCEVASFTAYGFYSDQPELRRPLREGAWSFTASHQGGYEQIADSSVRALLPSSSITAQVQADRLTQRFTVQVPPLPRTSPYFPIEDVSTGLSVKVGASMRNSATEFYCDGDRPSSRPAAGVVWSSDSAGVLSCTPSGTCTGLKAGTANVFLHYQDREVTHRPVTVFADSPAASAAAGPKPPAPVPTVRTLKSLSITPARSTIRPGEAVSFSVLAIYDDGSSEDVTGDASYSYGNPFVGKDTGTYFISAMYKGLIARGASVNVVKDPVAGAANAATASASCPAGQVRARDGSCVAESSVSSVLEGHATRQAQRAEDAPAASNVYVDQQRSSAGPFGPDSLRAQVDEAATAADAGGRARDSSAGSRSAVADETSAAATNPAAPTSVGSPAQAAAPGAGTTATPTATPAAAPTVAPPVTPARPTSAASAPAAAVATPTKPQVPTGPYQPTGRASKCSPLAAAAQSQCTQIFKDCKAKNCAPPGYSGCEVDCGSCNVAWLFNDYWCQLHASFGAAASSLAAAHIAASRACVSAYLTDGKPGRTVTENQCLGAARKKLDDDYNAAVARSCQSRCAEDGRRGVVKTNPHRCECQ